MENEGWQKAMLWVSFVFFLGALLLRQEAAINQDLGRHLRLGQTIVENDPPGARYQALATNFLTYTYPEYPFVNHHWSSEVIFYILYKMGGFSALIIFKAIVLGLAFVITARHVMASKGPTLSSSRSDLNRLAFAVGVIFFSIQMIADRLTTRPEIFGYLLFSLLFWILDKKDLSNWRNLPNLMLIPIIMILWVNLHISFVFGVILIWTWSLSKLIKKGPTLPYGKVGPYQTIAIPLVSTLITIFNPAGLRGAVMPLSIMKDYGYTIVENMTPFFLRAFKPQPEYWIYALILLATIILGVVRPSSAKATDGKGFGKVGMFGWITLLIFSIFPLLSVRHLAFFGLAAPIVLTPLLVGVLKGSTLAYAKVEPYHIPILVAVGLFLAATTNPIPLAYAKLPAVGLTEDKRHEEAVKFARGKQGKMWNNYDIGSYLEWSLPEHKTFVDGRPEAFPTGFSRETYIPMQESRQKWDEVVERYDIQWVFAALTDATPWFGKWRQMIGAHEGWKVIYVDSATAILARQN